MAEQNLGLVYNAVKIPDVGYFPEKLVFDGVTAKEALGTLSDFAVDHVYGVDEYRSLYFKPRNHSINEQARLTVGKHIASYKPSWDVDKVFNWARVKGGNIDSEGEQWLCIVEDKESQAAYGLRQKVLSLPSAYSVNDAKRWGENQIARYKDPVRSAKITGVRLEYPYPDGTFNVRHMGTDGKAQIRTLDGSEYEYPITKIKYTILPKMESRRIWNWESRLLRWTGICLASRGPQRHRAGPVVSDTAAQDLRRCNYGHSRLSL